MPPLFFPEASALKLDSGVLSSSLGELLTELLTFSQSMPRVTRVETRWFHAAIAAFSAEERRVGVYLILAPTIFLKKVEDFYTAAGRPSSPREVSGACAAPSAPAAAALSLAATAAAAETVCEGICCA